MRKCSSRRHITLPLEKYKKRDFIVDIHDIIGVSGLLLSNSEYTYVIAKGTLRIVRLMS